MGLETILLTIAAVLSIGAIVWTIYRLIFRPD